jgi:hypothetical protein
MDLCYARQWCHSRPGILGFLASILLHTTAVILMLTDMHSERKRQIAEVLMNTPFFLFASFVPFCACFSRLVRRKYLTQECYFMLLAAANFWATFSFGMVLNLLLVLWLGLSLFSLLEFSRLLGVLVLDNILITLYVWGFGIAWDIAEAKANAMICTRIC